MNKLILTNRFKKSHKQFVQKYPFLKNKIKETIHFLEVDIFHPSLKTHKLYGNLYGLKACSCGYDCRIIFIIEKNQTTQEEEIVLLDIGTHHVIY